MTFPINVSAYCLLPTTYYSPNNHWSIDQSISRPPMRLVNSLVFKSLLEVKCSWSLLGPFLHISLSNPQQKVMGNVHGAPWANFLTCLNYILIRVSQWKILLDFRNLWRCSWGSQGQVSHVSLSFSLLKVNGNISEASWADSIIFPS